MCFTGYIHLSNFIMNDCTLASSSDDTFVKSQLGYSFSNNFKAHLSTSQLTSNIPLSYTSPLQLQEAHNQLSGSPFPDTESQTASIPFLANIMESPFLKMREKNSAKDLSVIVIHYGLK